jgi:hypothetical protein
VKYIGIALMLYLSLPFQKTSAIQHSDAYTRVVGSIVRYDASMSNRTSQADLIIKGKSEASNKYTRLRYAPDGFGFDAPTTTRDKLMPKEMFSDGRLEWTFHVHTPRNDEEKTACKFRGKHYIPGKYGKMVEVERFVAVPGHENESFPNPESLPCFIIERWAKGSEI